MSSIDLRPIEKAKIDCAKVLFNKMKTNDVQYEVVKDYKELLNKALNLQMNSLTN